MTMADLEEASEKVSMGPERRSHIVSEKERKLTAYHESGHAIVAHLLPHADPVHKVTIIPRGRAGGYTMMLPTEEQKLQNKISIISRYSRSPWWSNCRGLDFLKEISSRCFWGPSASNKYSTRYGNALGA